MKCIWAVFLLASDVRGADVTLWTTGDDIVSTFVRFAATEQATRMFAAIGVRLQWKTHRRVNPDDGMVIQVRFTTDMPGHPGALAFANPFDPVPVVTQNEIAVAPGGTDYSVSSLWRTVANPVLYYRRWTCR